MENHIQAIENDEVPVLVIDMGDVADLTLGGAPDPGREDKRFAYS
jgi:hypothetical protein